jgi:hypothetical protein
MPTTTCSPDVEPVAAISQEPCYVPRADRFRRPLPTDLSTLSPVAAVMGHHLREPERGVEPLTFALQERCSDRLSYSGEVRKVARADSDLSRAGSQPYGGCATLQERAAAADRTVTAARADH